MIKTVILAAGMARRLQPLTLSTPKCLIPVEGKTLLDRALIAIKACGLKNIVIVTGFEADQIKSHCNTHHSDLQFEWLHNQRYDETNNIYSLWLTKDVLKDHQMLLLDSDILFHWRILDNLLNSGHENCLALRESNVLGEEEIKVIKNSEGDVQAISKTVKPSEAIGESLGIELFGSALTNKLMLCIDEFVVSQKRENDFYEAAFEQVIRNGAQIKPVPVGKLPCMEIDTVQDLQAAIRLAQVIDNETEEQP